MTFVFLKDGKTYDATCLTDPVAEATIAVTVSGVLHQIDAGLFPKRPGPLCPYFEWKTYCRPTPGIR